MNTENTPIKTDTESNAPKAQLEDDLGLDAEDIGIRQEDAVRVIVCEGGCE